MNREKWYPAATFLTLVAAWMIATSGLGEIRLPEITLPSLPHDLRLEIETPWSVWHLSYHLDRVDKPAPGDTKDTEDLEDPKPAPAGQSLASQEKKPKDNTAADASPGERKAPEARQSERQSTGSAAETAWWPVKAAVGVANAMLKLLLALKPIANACYKLAI